MDILNTVDYFFVDPINRVRAVETGGMHVNSDRKEEKEEQNKEKRGFIRRKEIQVLNEEEGRMKSKGSTAENDPFHLWMQMAFREKDNRMDDHPVGEEYTKKKMELFLKEQEKVMNKILAEREEVKFNARA